MDGSTMMAATPIFLVVIVVALNGGASRRTTPKRMWYYKATRRTTATTTTEPWLFLLYEHNKSFFLFCLIIRLTNHNTIDHGVFLLLKRPMNDFDWRRNILWIVDV
jgi:hypothetical protein